MNNLFVYGTLQHGQSRNSILKGLKYEKAFISGFEKVEPPSLGFPFIIRKERHDVKGEVYFNVPNSLLERIDIIENEGILYHRIVVEVVMINGKKLDAFIYYPSENLLKDFK